MTKNLILIYISRPDYLSPELQNIYENIQVCLYQMHQKLMIVSLLFYISWPG